MRERESGEMDERERERESGEMDERERETETDREAAICVLM